MRSTLLSRRSQVFGNSKEPTKRRSPSCLNPSAPTRSRIQDTEGRGLTGAFASVLWMQNASVSRSEDPLILANVQSNLAFHIAAKQIRRLFGPCGGADRQDVLVAADMGAPTGRKRKAEKRERMGVRGKVKTRKKVADAPGFVIAASNV